MRTFAFMTVIKSEHDEGYAQSVIVCSFQFTLQCEW